MGRAHAPRFVRSVDDERAFTDVSSGVERGVVMGAIIVALRGSDHKRLEALAADRAMSAKDLAGVLLEQAIRTAKDCKEADHGPDR